MKKLVIFLYIDALSPSLLSDDIMPFLSSLATKHSYHVLENVLGYSFAIQSCILSGKYPDETNYWLPYFYCPEKSPPLFKVLSLAKAIHPLDRMQTPRYLAVRWLRKLFLKKGVQANNIPLCIIGKIALYPFYYMNELPCFFELGEQLEEKTQTALTYIGPPRQRTKLQTALFEHLKASKHEKEVIIIYYDGLDGLGHTFGPQSHRCLNYARSLDYTLAMAYRKLKNLYGRNLTFLVFSDHGQLERKFQVDILSQLDKKGLKLGDDYICFIDATLALFWPEDEAKKEKILSTLNKTGRGIIIDPQLRKKYHMEFGDEKYGEIIYVLNPGGTFVPNFFSPFGAMKGLHGYLPEENVQKAFLISDENYSHQLNHVTDLRKFIHALCSPS